MRGAQNRLNEGRPFTKWLDSMGEKPTEYETDGLLSEEAKTTTVGSTNAMVVITSDRGLCGGCNSITAKVTRNQMAELNDHTPMFVVGEKGRAQLRRNFAANFKGSVVDCWGTPPTFSLACGISESILTAMKDSQVENMHVVYNQFVSAIQYQTSIRSIKTGLPASSATADDASVAPEEPFLQYEFEPDNREEVLQDLGEFQLASAVFHGMIENATSEQSARMAAMENATSNATDLIERLTLVYNKARQTRITTELIEIISGAACLASQASSKWMPLLMQQHRLMLFDTSEPTTRDQTVSVKSTTTNTAQVQHLQSLDRESIAD